MKFNERIRALREDKDLNQTQVGQIMNMTQRKISRLETGESEPTTDEIISFCKFYKVSADYILGLTDKMKGI